MSEAVPESPGLGSERARLGRYLEGNSSSGDTNSAGETDRPERPATRTTDRPVRIVRVIARLNVGGPAIHVLNLSAHLDPRFRTTLVAGQVDADEADFLEIQRSPEVDLLVLPELGRRVHIWQDAIAFLKLYALFRRIRPTIVHTHTAKAGTLGRIAAVVARVPIRIHTFHGHVMRGYFSPLVSRVVNLVERVLARVSTCLVTVSPSQARELVEQFRVCPPEQMRVVPLGFDLERFSSERIRALSGEFRREIGAGDGLIVSVIGRLVPIKDHPTLIRAAAELRAREVPFVLAIVGGGPEEGSLRELVDELGIGDCVRFLGWRDDLERIYADTDIVALSSKNEGTPVCLIEALASGCAVVATDVGGVRDVLENGRLGTLVASGDYLALAEGILSVSGKGSERDGAGGEGARSVRVRYGLSRLVDDVTALYEELLTRRGLMPPVAEAQSQN